MLLEYVNKISAILTLLSQVFLAGAVILLFFPKTRNYILIFFGRHGMLLAFLVAVASLVLSLFYSDYIGYEPCKLCWYQRIFIYPQVIILGMALYRKDYKIINYALALLFVGTVISLYHNYLSLGGSPFFNCDAFSLGASCTKLYVFELNYITIPIMSLTSFLLMFFFLKVQKLYNK
ncbi:MAG: putative disulfide formation protein [Candidatus Giovannonibacteria bacterium GW2011_GWC2_44_9]|uniref:Putative disulfide formation protein n=1 Tax=Candidatus Giovannonibacteria bacterium GW2011_GWC2_44_9 TaxID=1618658 RepID=A0A0G1NFI4_9BACT|nr:MAG: putative disulfide formation protein [Candidatus Giovannonibacteria bacterium GW2011_GWC2_44_9]